METRVALDQITIDSGLQCRVTMSRETIDRYRECLDDLPPVVLVSDGFTYWLAEGFHRFVAHQEEGRKDILAKVVKGTKLLAQEIAIEANGTHGLPRTREDRAKAIQLALQHPKYEKLTDHAIAKLLKVSPKTVTAYRLKEFQAEQEQDQPGQAPAQVPGTTPPGSKASPNPDSPAPQDRFGAHWGRLYSDLLDACYFGDEVKHLKGLSADWRKRQKEGHSFAKKVDIAEVTALLDRLAEIYTDTVPYCVCQVCGGKGCEICRVGWASFGEASTDDSRDGVLPAFRLLVGRLQQDGIYDRLKNVPLTHFRTALKERT